MAIKNAALNANEPFKNTVPNEVGSDTVARIVATNFSVENVLATG